MSEDKTKEEEKKKKKKDEDYGINNSTRIYLEENVKHDD